MKKLLIASTLAVASMSAMAGQLLYASGSTQNDAYTAVQTQASSQGLRIDGHIHCIDISSSYWVCRAFGI